MDDLSHLDERGQARMVDVGEKPETHRRASAQARITMRPETARLVEGDGIPKGDVLAVARIAGIQAAKRTPELVPLCHPLALTHVALEAEVEQAAIRFTATCETRGRTGVEMEALTAASVAALTAYDMLKAVDREMTIESTRVLSKHGGTSDPEEQR